MPVRQRTLLELPRSSYGQPVPPQHVASLQSTLLLSTKPAGPHNMVGTPAELLAGPHPPPDTMVLMLGRLQDYTPAARYSLMTVAAVGMFAERPGQAVLWAYALAVDHARHAPGNPDYYLPVADLVALRLPFGPPLESAKRAAWAAQKTTRAKLWELVRGKPGTALQHDDVGTGGVNLLDYGVAWQPDSLAAAPPEPAPLAPAAD